MATVHRDQAAAMFRAHYGRELGPTIINWLDNTRLPFQVKAQGRPYLMLLLSPAAATVLAAAAGTIGNQVLQRKLIRAFADPVVHRPFEIRQPEYNCLHAGLLRLATNLMPTMRFL